MHFKYIAALLTSLAVNGALAIPVPDAEVSANFAQFEYHASFYRFTDKL